MTEDNVVGKEARLRYKLNIASRLLYKLIKDTRCLEADRQRLLTENQKLKEKLRNSEAKFGTNQTFDGVIPAAKPPNGNPDGRQPQPSFASLPLANGNRGSSMDTVWDLLR